MDFSLRDDDPFLVWRILTTEPFLLHVDDPMAPVSFGVDPGSEYSVFGVSSTKDRALIKMLKERAARRYAADGARTLYLWVWSKDKASPTFAERIIPAGYIFKFSNDLSLLRSIPWTPETTSLNRFVSAGSEWRFENASDTLHVPLQGAFAFYRALRVYDTPAFPKLLAAFESHYM